MDLQQIAEELVAIVGQAEPKLLGIGEQLASEASAEGKWSPKQTVGHLIDSASNNHQRFVRLQLTVELTMPSYQQDGWVRANAYSSRPWAELIGFWAAYNRHLAHVIRYINPEHLDNTWLTDSGSRDLGFLIRDYLVHLNHHLAQLID
jgi:DinB superfamily